MIRIRLIKSWTNMQGRKYFKGEVLAVDNSLALRLLEGKYGFVYEGDYPNVKKMRTNFKNKE